MTKGSSGIAPAGSDSLVCSTPDGAVKMRCLFKDETARLTQKTMADLFGVKVPAINKQLKDIFASGELVEASAVSILEKPAADWNTYQRPAAQAAERRSTREIALALTADSLGLREGLAP